MNIKEKTIGDESRRGSNLRTVPIVVWALPAILLTVAISHLPYTYYIFMRWAVSLAACFIAWQIYRGGGRLGFSLILFVALAVLFNPIAPVRFKREIWEVLNAVAAIIFVCGGFCSKFWLRPRKATLMIEPPTFPDEDSTHAWQAGYRAGRGAFPHQPGRHVPQPYYNGYWTGYEVHIRHMTMVRKVVAGVVGVIGAVGGYILASYFDSTGQWWFKWPAACLFAFSPIAAMMIYRGQVDFWTDNR